MDRWHRFATNHPRLARAMIAGDSLRRASLFFLDMYTDVNLTYQVHKTGKHPGWTRLLTGFLCAPFLVAGLGVFSYARAKSPKAFALRSYGELPAWLFFVSVTFLICVVAVPVLDVCMMLLYVPGLTRRLGLLLPEEVAVLMVSYEAVRVLTECMARQDFAEHFHTFRVWAQTLTGPSTPQIGSQRL